MEFHEEECWGIGPKVFLECTICKEAVLILKDSDVPLEQDPKLKPHAVTVFVMQCNFGRLAKSLSKNPSLKDFRSYSFETQMNILSRQSMICLTNHLQNSLIFVVEAVLEIWSPEMKNAWGEAFDWLVAGIKI
uniref:Globin family profile domain-containing protein n=1 Tax=Salix viminalis TaxID=40686 RepID=A0A6N2L3N5_SALVM